jgi:phage shock protein A
VSEIAKLRERVRQLEAALDAVAHDRNGLARELVDSRDDYTSLTAEYLEHRRACAKEQTSYVKQLVARNRTIKELRVEMRVLRKELSHKC